MKSDSLKIKKILILSLAVVFSVVSISSTTFSWFSRPQKKTGKALSYSVPYLDADNHELPMIAYDGKDVEMKTYISFDDGIHFSDDTSNASLYENLTLNDDLHDLAQTYRQLGTVPYEQITGDQHSNRVYFKTVLTNYSATPQNVSLYIKNFRTGTGGQVCVGTNVPVKSFKNYTTYGVAIAPASKVSANGQTKRLYFQPRCDSSHNSSWLNKDYYVFYDNNGTLQQNNSDLKVQLQSTPTSGTYYADIPAKAKKLYFAYEENWTTGNQRTQTFTDLNSDGLSSKNSLLFYLNDVSASYGNHKAFISSGKIDGACFAKYYSTGTITMGFGQQLNIGLTKDTDYTGATNSTTQKSITYTSSNTGVFTVADNGEITPIAGGNATLTYSVTSQYGDTATKTATIIVKGSEDHLIPNAPIVTNLLIPAGTQENIANKKNVQDVYWFVQNGDSMYGVAGENAEFNLDYIYLGV